MIATNTSSPVTAPLDTAATRGASHAGPLLVAAGGDDFGAVLRAASLLSDHLGRETLVVSALDPLQQYAWQPESGVFPRTEFLADARRNRVEHELASLGTRTRWPLKVELGGVSRVLARVAEETDASLLVMGLGRHHPIDRLVGAETAVKTVRHAPCPVLAVPRGFTALPTVAVVGMDFSDASIHAARTALTLLAPGATLHLVHVWQPSDLDSGPEAEHDELYRLALPVRFRDAIAALAPRAGITVKGEAREGRPAERLLDFAAAHHATLMVVGRHGEGLLERLLVGRVATRVLRAATCAVLVVPEPALQARREAEQEGGITSIAWERKQWSEKLDEFARRNAGRITTLEMSGVGRVPYSRELGYVLFGTGYREPVHELEIILGEANGRRRHLTSVIPDATSVELLSEASGAEMGLRIQHGTGQTLLTLMPRTASGAATPAKSASD